MAGKPMGSESKFTAYGALMRRGVLALVEAEPNSVVCRAEIPNSASGSSSPTRGAWNPLRRLRDYVAIGDRRPPSIGAGSRPCSLRV